MDELTLDRLELPDGGWVEFNDPEALKGRDVDRMREAWQGAKNAGHALNTAMQIGVELLIARWDLPGLPGVPVPSQSPQFWGEMGWRTKQAIEMHIATVVGVLCGFSGAPAGAPSPQTPASA